MARQVKSTGCLVLFGAVFMLVGCLPIGLAAWSFIQSQAAQSWHETPCIIKELEFHSRTSTDSDGHTSTTYNVTGSFSYYVDDMEYTSEQLVFSVGSDSFESYWRELYDRLDQARRTESATCFYDPNDPTQAVIDRTVRVTHLIFLIIFGLIFFTIGAVVAIGIPLFGRRRQNKGITATTAQPPTGETTHALPAHRAKAAAAGLSLFALLWNLISWPIALLFLVDDEAKEWFAYVLLSLFPLVGSLVAIGAFFALKNYFRLRTYRYGLPNGVPVPGNPATARLIGLPAAASWVIEIAEVSEHTSRSSNGNTSTSLEIDWSYRLTVADAELRQADHSLLINFPLPNDATGQPGTHRFWQLILKDDTGTTTKLDLPLDQEIILGPLDRSTILSATDQTVDQQAGPGSKYITLEASRVIINTPWTSGLIGRLIGMFFGGIFAFIGFAIWFWGDAPFIFAFIFGLLGLPIFIGLLIFLFQSVHVTVDRLGVRGYTS
jgi:hypothetical protein